MKDFLSFKTMLTPRLIAFVFWFATAAIALRAIGLAGQAQAGQAMVLLVVGPVLVRISCELSIVLFRINESLTELTKK